MIAAPDQLTLDRVTTDFARPLQQAWLKLDKKQRRLKFERWDRVPDDVREMVGDPWLAESDEAAHEPADEQPDYAARELDQAEDGSMGVVDLIVAGGLEGPALAAVGLGNTWSFAALIFGLGVASGMNLIDPAERLFEFFG